MLNACFVFAIRVMLVVVVTWLVYQEWRDHRRRMRRGA